MSEQEDKLIDEKMAKLSRGNEDISGDEDSEEEEDTGMGEIDEAMRKAEAAGNGDCPVKNKLVAHPA
ncbi:hypothetical protein H5410_016121 [Solanum commersonii]|uniref:Uncharacterized protein n=1 Tax=Solanum commersonii TaxID=4109 RepID=A0A9J5ZVL3_SOLCO|nr:hypothetical protein H5410_016121 [Solanum commersonii]